MVCRWDVRVRPERPSAAARGGGGLGGIDGRPEDKRTASSGSTAPAGAVCAAADNESSYPSGRPARVAELKWRRRPPNVCSDRPRQFGRRPPILDQARSGYRIHPSRADVPQVRRCAEPRRPASLAGISQQMIGRERGRRRRPALGWPSDEAVTFHTAAR